MIGHGSFGTVYLVIDTRTGEKLAAKMLTGIFDDVTDAKRLMREISILKTMDHPNIVSIRDIIIPNDTPIFNSCILIMEAA